ncbi:MAG TPA: GNAT family N-acetyltransferase [Bacilli bacterium]|nr:GNAT family N-acetyltransferase [Bacilli bacterium]
MAQIKRADENFNLIEDNDRIVIGISGGKDSIVLFYALTLYQKFSNKNFTLIPIMLDLGFDRFDAENYKEYFRTLGYELDVADSRQVFKILEIQQGQQRLSKLPCSICSRMKKAAINKEANEIKANKVAFAHHIDDALETMMMNMISGGRLATFAPKMYLENAKITFIRPLIFVEESSIIKTQMELDLPVMKSGCPNDKKTRREDIKNLLNEIYINTPEAKSNFQLMLTNYQHADLWFDKLEFPLGDGLTLKPVTGNKTTTDMLKIRFEVFVIEQKVALSEEIEDDEDSYSAFVLYLHHDPIGTIRYKHLNKQTIKLGRIAIIKSARGHGYGRRVINFVEQLVYTKVRPLTIQLGAQIQAENFYARLGYTPIGEQYVEANILHVNMQKSLK